MKQRKFMVTTLDEYLNEEVNSDKEFVAYHSTYSEIDEFDFDKIELKPNSSTRISGIFFSNVPQTGKIKQKDYNHET